MRIRTALLAMSAMVTAPSIAMASTITGPYVDLGVGYNLVQNQRFTNIDSKPQSRTKVEHGNGYNGFLSAGWGLGNGLRLEVEGAYNFNYNKRTLGAANRKKLKGHSQGYGALTNVLYDIDLKNFGIDSPVTPFVGIGAGYMWQNYKMGLKGKNYSMNSTAGGFAVQGIAGAAYDIPGVPGLALTTQYRFLAQTGTGSDLNIGTYRNASNNRIRADVRYTHQFILGLRYAFDNAPPPAPPAPVHVVVPPQPAPARTYLVFFDWDKSDLTSRAREIVSQAAQASTHVQTTRIEVNGYTDNSAAHPGHRGEKYNTALSLRRANSVKAELIHDGVPADAIDIHGYGDAHPLVVTAKNTREPQNRRVEIILK